MFYQDRVVTQTHGDIHDYLTRVEQLFEQVWYIQKTVLRVVWSGDRDMTDIPTAANDDEYIPLVDRIEYAEPGCFDYIHETYIARLQYVESLFLWGDTITRWWATQSYLDHRSWAYAYLYITTDARQNSTHPLDMWVPPDDRPRVPYAPCTHTIDSCIVDTDISRILSSCRECETDSREGAGIIAICNICTFLSCCIFCNNSIWERTLTFSATVRFFRTVQPVYFLHRFLMDFIFFLHILFLYSHHISHVTPPSTPPTSWSRWGTSILRRHHESQSEQDLTTGSEQIRQVRISTLQGKVTSRTSIDNCAISSCKKI
jgi:hypothetical protein